MHRRDDGALLGIAPGLNQYRVTHREQQPGGVIITWRITHGQRDADNFTLDTCIVFVTCHVSTRSWIQFFGRAGIILRGLYRRGFLLRILGGFGKAWIIVDFFWALVAGLCVLCQDVNQSRKT